MTQRDDKERYKVRREKLADFFYALAKLIFAGLVVGGIPSLTSGNGGVMAWANVFTGIIVTILTAAIGNRILKY